MAVYFAPQRQPWWTDPLKELVMGQIGAMMDRTKEAKTIEAQRGMVGMLAELQKQNPGMTGSDLMTQVMADKNFARSGEMGPKILERVMADADRRNAEAELMAMGGDTAGMLRPLMLAGKAGVDQKLMAELQYPTLVQRNANLGDRYVGQMVNPRTGKVVGDSLESPIGIDQGTLAKLAQDDKHTMAKLAFDREKEKRIADEGRKPEDPYKNGRWVQDKNGEWIHVTPSGKKASTGVIGQLTDPRQYADPNSLTVKDQIKFLFDKRASLVTINPEDNAEAIAYVDKQIDDLMKYSMSAPSSQMDGQGGPIGIPGTSHGDNVPPSLVSQDPKEQLIRRFMIKTGKSHAESEAWVNAQFPELTK